jgi:hypothetical protein
MTHMYIVHSTPHSRRHILKTPLRHFLEPNILLRSYLPNEQLASTRFIGWPRLVQSKSFALLCMSSPMMSPNSPRIAAKISIVRILTNLKQSVSTWEGIFQSTYKDGSAASARAALLPLMPTQTPQIRLHMPTVNPAQNSAYPVNMLEGE